MRTASHTFHADVFGQDCEVGYHMADVGTDREELWAVVDHITHSSSGDELLEVTSGDVIARLAKEATERFKDAKDTDVFGGEKI